MHGRADENAGAGHIRKRRRDVRWIQRVPTVDTHAAEQRHQDGKLHAVHVLRRHGRHDPRQELLPQRGRRLPGAWTRSGRCRLQTLPRSLGSAWAGRCCRTCSRSRPRGRAGLPGSTGSGSGSDRSRLLDAGIVQRVAARMLCHHLVDHRGNPRRRQQADLAADEHGREGDEEVVAPLAEVQRRGPVGECRRQRAAQAPGIDRRS